jgi:hypothetical protein
MISADYVRDLEFDSQNSISRSKIVIADNLTETSLRQLDADRNYDSLLREEEEEANKS